MKMITKDRLFFYVLSCFFIISNHFNVINARDMFRLSAGEREQALINKLLKDYSKKQKPSGTIDVKFALNLNQIVNVKAKDQVFMLNVFLDHEWVDNRLQWEPEANGNISILRISSEYLWTPDTFVYTTADSTGFLLPQKGAYFVVGNDGRIFWPNPLPQMKVRCRMGIVWFPYDEQLCEIIFGSWSNTQGYLNYTLMNEESALAGYTENSEWSLTSYKGYRVEIKYDNWIEDDSFSNIHYKILIRRKPLFVLQNYCIPAVMLCVITLCSFFMPFAQEMQLGISVMLTFSILKLKLSDDVPAQSDSIPLFNIYFTGCMVFSLLSIIWFNQMNLFNTRKNVPKLCRIVILKYICAIMNTPSFKIVKIDNSNELPKESKNMKELTVAEKRHGMAMVDGVLGNNYSSVAPEIDCEILNSNYRDFKILKSASYFSMKPLEFTRDCSDSRGSKEDLTPINERKSFENNYINDHLESRGATNFPEELENMIEEGNQIKEERMEYTDMEIIPILNHFIFYLFVLYIVLLNGLLLVAFPMFLQTPLKMSDPS